MRSSWHPPSFCPGAATRLESQFRLTYSMILNLLRVEDLKVLAWFVTCWGVIARRWLSCWQMVLSLLLVEAVSQNSLTHPPAHPKHTKHTKHAQVEDMLRRSFAEFHAQRAQPELLAALEKGRAALGRLRARPWPASPLGSTRCVAATCCFLVVASCRLEGIATFWECLPRHCQLASHLDNLHRRRRLMSPQPGRLFSPCPLPLPTRASAVQGGGGAVLPAVAGH